MAIKTYEAACKALKHNPNDLPVVSMLPEKHQKSIIAYAKLIIAAQAFRKGWEPNWNDDNQVKYFPWFEVKADDKNTGGTGFSVVICDYWYTGADVGSRLCFPTSKMAIEFGETFQELYKDYLLLT